MNKQQFIDRWLPYWVEGDEPKQFKDDLDQLLADQEYTENHDGTGTIITKDQQLNEMQIIKQVWGNRPVYDLAMVITALEIALKQPSQC